MDAVTEAQRLGISRKHAVSYRNDAEGVALNYAATGGEKAARSLRSL